MSGTNRHSAAKASAPGNPSAGWRTSIPAAGALGFVLLACAGPTDPPDPPTGGQELVLDFARFESDVLPVLTQQGCDAGGDCHGGGIRGTFALSPIEEKDPIFDFEQASLQVLPVEREESPLLIKPLAVAAGGAPHSYKVFETTDDPGFVAIRGWIEAGVLR
ncbi:MAG: hypothetical protein KC729_18155 [Candidatus Eisenbacteria bacterium]|uniref:Uncharacterized protein n=1 Tax=Eiseniibacteriota bacterium TaxID=2212470 RepID=A0A956M1L2_UNCEI|nr:hypothetical protein [Candidatus Eisenbacteria bacterium]